MIDIQIKNLTPVLLSVFKNSLKLYFDLIAKYLNNFFFLIFAFSILIWHIIYYDVTLSKLC